MSSSRPNILLILTDQHRRDSLGCYGSSVCRTPHLDRLAHEGVRFDEAFTNTAICTAARASLLTGLEPHIGYPWELPEGLIPFSTYLVQAGYRCGIEGKWHLGLSRGPEYYGFEGTHFPGWDAPKSHPEYVAYLEERSLPAWRVNHILRGTFPNGQPSLPMAGICEGPVESTFPYFLAERTIKRLADYAEAYHHERMPFFLRTDFFGPHLPYYIPADYARMYDPSLVTRTPSMAETFEGKPQVHRSYCRHWAFDTYPWETWQQIVAMFWGYVTLIDEQIGRILEALDALDLTDNTVVIFGADHAGFVGNHRLADKGPMMYDDIYRIPLLIRWPGHAQPNTACSAFVTLMDLMPTFLDMAGVPIPNQVAGCSMVPLVEGHIPDDWPQEVLLQFHGHHFPYPQRGIRTERYKLVVNPADINELYDLETDPYELHNVIANPVYADVRRDLMRRLYRHLVNSKDNFYHWMTTMFEVNV